MAGVFGEHGPRIDGIYKQTVALVNQAELTYRHNAHAINHLGAAMGASVRAFVARTPGLRISNTISIPTSTMIFSEDKAYRFCVQIVGDLVFVFVERDGLVISYHVDVLVHDEAASTFAPSPVYRFQVGDVQRRFKQAAFYDITHVILDSGNLLPVIMFTLDAAEKREVSPAGAERMEGVSSDNETDRKRPL